MKSIKESPQSGQLRGPPNFVAGDYLPVGYKETKLTIPNFDRYVYEKGGLLTLLHYATLHKHSHLWIRAILAILDREGGSRG